MADQKAEHWDRRYQGSAPEELTWFEADPALSRGLISARARAAGAGADATIFEIGGGAARLPEALLDEGFTDLTVLDISAEALARSRAQLGPEQADRVSWVVGDVTAWRPKRSCDIWHDRAVFHFLTERADRARYLANLTHALRPGGSAIIMTFADDGPEKCSGLPVARYSPATLAAEFDSLAPGMLIPVEEGRFVHETPSGGQQRFQFSVFQRAGMREENARA